MVIVRCCFVRLKALLKVCFRWSKIGGDNRFYIPRVRETHNGSAIAAKDTVQEVLHK